MDKKTKIKIGIAAGLLIIAVAAIALSLTKTKQNQRPSGPGKEQRAAATVVKAEIPSTGNIKLTTELSGTVEPSDVVYVYAKASGDVTDVMVKAGDIVTQGQTLCKIDTDQVASAQNSMDSASVSLSQAQSNLNRMKILHDGGDLSDQEYEQYSNQVKTAKLQYQSAKINYDKQIEYSTITAPIGGKIESFDIDVHDNVSPSNQLCVITGDGEKRISFYVTERMMQNISVGDKLDIKKGDVSYEASISEISSMVDSEKGLFKVKAQLKDGTGIATGSTVKLSLVTDHTENAMTVPVDAIYYSGGIGYVYVYNDGVVNKKEVEVGLYDSEKAEILSGISADEMVISTWSSNLYEGAKVQLKGEESKEPNQDKSSKDKSSKEPNQDKSSKDKSSKDKPSKDKPSKDKANQAETKTVAE